MRGQPDFEVIGFGRAKAHVTGAQQHDAVRQAQRLQHGFGVAGHFFQRVVAFFGVHDLHHLDLVKLVLADHAARVAAVAAGFRAKAWRVRSQAHGQVRFGDDFISHQVGQRHFRGGDQIQRSIFGFALLAALFGGKQVFFKLGQLAGAAQ